MKDTGDIITAWWSCDFEEKLSFDRNAVRKLEQQGDSEMPIQFRLNLRILMVPSLKNRVILVKHFISLSRKAMALSVSIYIGNSFAYSIAKKKYPTVCPIKAATFRYWKEISVKNKMKVKSSKQGDKNRRQKAEFRLKKQSSIPVTKIVVRRRVLKVTIFFIFHQQKFFFPYFPLSKILIN